MTDAATNLNVDKSSPKLQSELATKDSSKTNKFHCSKEMPPSLGLQLNNLNKLFKDTQVRCKRSQLQCDREWKQSMLHNYTWQLSYSVHAIMCAVIQNVGVRSKRLSMKSMSLFWEGMRKFDRDHPQIFWEDANIMIKETGGDIKHTHIHKHPQMLTHLPMFMTRESEKYYLDRSSCHRLQFSAN